MKQIFTLVLLFFLVAAAPASAASWSGLVKTDSGTWSVVRESSNLTFNYEQSVHGQIAPVHYRNRTLSPVYSNYEDIEKNDVHVKERTAAMEGSFRSEGALKLFSSIDDTVNLSINKPAGSDIYDIEFYEHWPVKLSYSKSMNYSGKEINNREFVGNSKDYAGANFLYNQEFSKERSMKMSLDRMNATILATDETINLGEVKATRDTQYRLQTHSTGIASFKWRQVDADDSILNEGNERYVGVYDIAKNIRMKSRFDLSRNDDSWLPCCSGGWSNMRLADKKGFGTSAKGVFDCSCYNVP